MNTITFREAVKLVHPDINPNVTNASYKITEIKKHRFNEVYLYTLLVKWGDIPSLSKNKKTVDKTKNNHKNYSPMIEVGDLIFVKTRDIVARVVKITRKRYYFMNNGIRTFCAKKNATKYVRS